MITKKFFLTTSSFLLTVCLTACTGYNLSQSRFQSKPVDLSAFNNLASNICFLSAPTTIHTTQQENTLFTNQIINIIDKEIKHKIYNTRYIISSSKKKNELQVTSYENKPKIKPFKNITDLSTYEINNKDMINLYSLSVEKVAYKKFTSNTLIALEVDKINDNVKVTQSSPLKEFSESNKAPEENTSAKNEQDFKTEIAEVESKDKDKDEDKEAIMFDYSKRDQEQVVTKTIDQKLYERPLSYTVKNAISREIGKEARNEQSFKSTQVSTHKEIVDSNSLDNR